LRRRPLITSFPFARDRTEATRGYGPLPLPYPEKLMTQTATGAAAAAPTAIGVGIDTARYGHHATFLRPDLQPAAADLDFAESAAGYAQLRSRLQTIGQRLGAVHFHFRLDVAGAYADNLLAFLRAPPSPAMR